MIRTYKNFLNEKLTDNLKGFDEQELKQQFLNGEIELQKYLRICDEYKFELPSKKHIEKFFKNDLMDINFYYLLCHNYHYEYPNFDDAKQKFLDKKIDVYNFTFICKEYYNIEITHNFIEDLLLNNGIKIKDYFVLINEYKLKFNDELIIKYINNNNDKINFYELVISAINIDNLSLLKVALTHEKNDFKHIKRSIFYESINCFKYLINYASDNEKCEALKTSCSNDKYIQYTKYLIENGADIHYENEYALKTAIDNEEIETIKYLLENGAVIKKQLHKLYDNSEIKELLKQYK